MYRPCSLGERFLDIPIIYGIASAVILLVAMHADAITVLAVYDHRSRSRMVSGRK